MLYHFFTTDKAHNKSCEVDRQPAELTNDYPNSSARKMAQALADGWGKTVYFRPVGQALPLCDTLFVGPNDFKNAGNFTPFQAAVLQKLNNIERHLKWARRLRLNRAEAAEYLGLSVWTLDKLRKEGHIRPVQLTHGAGRNSKRIGYLRTELDRYLNQNQLEDPTAATGEDLFQD